MELQQFEQIFARRGYSLVTEDEVPPDERICCGDDSPGVYVLREGQTTPRYFTTAGEVDYLHQVGLLTHYIDTALSSDQHHMQHFCGFPLLREAKNAGNKETLAYRAVSDGPIGKSLLECPHCLQYIQDDSVEEIED